MDLFLGYNWLVEHNPEVDWKEGVIWFTRYPEYCKMEHKSIQFTLWLRRLLPKEEKESKRRDKEPDPTQKIFQNIFNCSLLRP